MVIAVNEANLMDAAKIHSESWIASHRHICSLEALQRHTPGHQAAYLRDELQKGKRLYLLVEDSPVGIVSVCGNLIENLYILPGRQGEGHGTTLLEYAMEACDGAPTLWILCDNTGARRLYEKHGFIPTGKTKSLTESLYELEMIRA